MKFIIHKFRHIFCVSLLMIGMCKLDLAAQADPLKRNLFPEEIYPDSIYNWIRDSSGESWIYDTKNIYLLDTAENKYQIHRSSWNGDIWVNSFLLQNAFDEFENLTSYTSQKWKDSIWVNSFRYSYRYDDLNRETDFLYEKWNDTGWVNYLHRFTEIEDNPKWAQSVQQSWNGDSWKDQIRTTFLYDLQDVVTHKIQENWHGQWDSTYQTLYTHSTIPDADSTLLQSYGNNAQWYDLTRNVNFRDVKGDSYYFLNQQFFDQWENTSQSFSTFDDQHHETLYIRQVWDTSWVNSTRFETNYNDDGNILAFVREAWEGSWELTDSTHYYYPFETLVEQKPKSNQDVIVFPVPATDVLFVTAMIDGKNSWNYYIFSMTGQLMQSSKLDLTAVNKLDIESLALGSYLLVLKNGNRIKCQLFIKQ